MRSRVEGPFLVPRTPPPRDARSPSPGNRGRNFSGPYDMLGWRPEGLPMTREQKIVAAGSASGIVSMLAAMWLLSTQLPAPPGMETLADRLAYAARWLAFAALPLFAMVAAIGNARFLGEAIDRTLGAEDARTIVNGRVADNTTQQLLLFAAGSLGLAASLPAEWMGVIRAAAIVFVLCRIAFWIGYRIHPLHRAFGFASTAYLNLGLLLSAVWLAVD